MNRQQGFSLIELLIVVAIILIISGIAVPNLLKARISANESSAVGSIRALTSAAIQYFVQCPANGFPAALANLGPGDGSCAAVSAIDSILASGIKSGYSITYTPGAANAAGLISTYTILALPITPARVLLQSGWCHSLQPTGTACDATVLGDPSLQ